MREPLSKGLRAAIIERDSATCQYCGTTEARHWHIDHVIPVTLGGQNVLRNLVTACDTCNHRKLAAVWVPRNLDIICAGHPEYAARVRELIGTEYESPSVSTTPVTPAAGHLRWRIDELLRARGITASDLAQATGLATSTISELRTSKAKRFDRDTLGRLLEYFNCEVNDIMYLA